MNAIAEEGKLLGGKEVKQVGGDQAEQANLPDSSWAHAIIVYLTAQTGKAPGAQGSVIGGSRR